MLVPDLRRSGVPLCERMVTQAVALFISAMFGGALNSVAGGGSFLTFPALIVTGAAPVAANATSTFALWPGSVASVGAYRRELSALRHVVLLSALSVIGGGTGAILLLHTPAATFQRLIPLLLAVATGLFAFGEPVKSRLRSLRGPTIEQQGRLPSSIAAAQLVISVYGGYFGGGIGILMLAMLGVLGMEDIHQMNALKTLLATCINGIAVCAFVFAHSILWPQAIVMLLGAVVGGYAGAAGARKLQPRLVRRLVIAVGCAMTVYFALHA